MPETTSETPVNQPSSGSDNTIKPAAPATKVNRFLPVLALLGSLVLLGFSLYLFFNPDKPSALPSATPPPSPRPPQTPLSQNFQAAGPGQDFAFQAETRPTPTALPAGNEAARLRSLADAYLSQGRPVEAAAQYRQALEKYPDDPAAQPALFGLARSLMQTGRYAEAAENFKKYLAAYPNDPLRRVCNYYLGLAARELGQPDEAIGYLQKYQAEQPGQTPLDGYAWFEIADIYNNSRRVPQAMEAYKKVAVAETSNQLRVTALERLGDYNLKENRPAEAANWYAKVLEIARIPDYRASIIIKQARALEAAGQGQPAADLRRLLLDEYLDTPTGFNNLKTLYQSNSPVLNDYFRGYYAWRSGQPAEAIAAFNRFLGRPDDKAAQPAFAAGLNSSELNRLVWGWYYLGAAYEAKGDLNRAVQELNDLLARHPQAEAAPDTLQRLARLAERRNDHDLALRLYGQLADQPSAGPLAEDALYSQVRLAQGRGPEAAGPYIDNLVRKFPGSSRVSQAYYEQGRAFQAKNDQAGARTAFQKAFEAPEVTFYTVRAGERLKDSYDPNYPPRSNATTHPAVYSSQTFNSELDRDRRPMESWLAGWAANGATAQAAPPSPATTPGMTVAPENLKAIEAARSTVRQEAGFRRLLELKTLDREAQANREARELFDRYSDKPLELYVLALMLSENGEYYHSVASAKRLWALYQQKNPAADLRQAPLLMQKLIYPLPYQTMILEQSQRQNVDPLLMIALIKQESAFDPEATSSVGARGLSQVMPETGKGIAANLDKPGFKVDDLYRPYTAIEFGTYYLAARLKDFGANPYEALAAYNGGAGNVYRWSKAVSPNQNFDRWVENIDYPETRGYVQIIYANYFMYRQIYAKN